jgi:hypothetical protein
VAQRNQRKRRKEPEIKRNSLAKQFLDVSGSVDDSQNFDPFLERPMKNQISLEALNPPHSDGSISRIPEHPGGIDPGYLGQFLECQVGGLKETAGDVDTGILAKKNEVAN